MIIHQLFVAGTLIAGLMVAGCGMASAMDEKSDMPAKSMEKKAAMPQAVYVCPDCHTMAMKAGKCPKCQKKMVSSHVLGTKDGQIILCACEPGCKCDPSAMKDGKCGCGKDVKMMSAKGMYVCPMGCPEVSNKPGKCACGREMKKVE